MFVCLGNICRSPLAEALFRKHIREAGADEYFEIQSSGTGSWHVGNGADDRMCATADRRGVSLDAHVAQQFDRKHLEQFDHVFVMDKNNLHDVLFLDDDDVFARKVRLFREFDPEPGNYQVPDPYYGGDAGFNNVFEIVDRTAKHLAHEMIGLYEIPVHDG